MESKRQHKFSRQILKDINEVFQKDPRHYFGEALATITKVDVAADLSLAKVYFSVLPTTAGPGVIELLDERKSEVRKKLGLLIGKRIRKIPELAFFHDDIEEKAAYMDKLIAGLVIPPEDTEEKAD
ncbi:MAG: ribosome-binding factor A [Cyclobacteriaceae bacterium]|jgi:ribosome-binding factor A